MNTESIIDFLIKNEKGLTKNEIEKLRSNYDSIFFNEKIAEHMKRARWQAGVTWASVAFTLISALLILAKPILGNLLIGFLYGLLIALFVLIIVFISNLLKNHSRIALILKIVKEIRENK